MWDPKAYRDTDYGLRGDERFEPEEEPNEGQVLERPTVMTLLGPIEPDQVGICQPHEHVLRDASASDLEDAERRLDRLDFAAAELEIYFTVGGRSMVDLTTKDQGRNLPGLLALAQRVPVHLIASTGLRASPDDQLRSVEDVIAEISDGVGPGRTRPGVLTVTGEAVTIADFALQLAGIAGATGIPLFVQDIGDAPLAQILDLLSGFAELDSSIMVGGVEPEMGLEFLVRLATSGAYLCFDSIGRRGPDHDQDVARTIATLAEAGLADRILVSQGLDRTSQFVSYGGTPGWGYLLERFTLTLMETGSSAMLVRQVLVGNPAAALAMSPSSRGK
jgi:phosphotriesterase-related protein